MHRTYYSGVERGIRNLSLVNIGKIARGLKKSLPDLFASGRRIPQDIHIWGTLSRKNSSALFRSSVFSFLYTSITLKLLQFRDELWLVWRAGFSGFNRREQLDSAIPVPVTAKNKPMWEHANENLPAEPMGRVVCEEWLREASAPWIVKWDRQKALRANPRCLPSVLALACIRHANRFGFCRNRDCPAPHFFRVRRDQRYCSVVCEKRSAATFSHT